jgi:hypothetical protein
MYVLLPLFLLNKQHIIEKKKTTMITSQKKEMGQTVFPHLVENPNRQYSDGPYFRERDKVTKLAAL